MREKNTPLKPHRFKSFLPSLLVLSITFAQTSLGQTLIDNQLMTPVSNIVMEVTGVDSRLCASQCGEIMAVGKFRNGGSDTTSDINIFVAYLASKGASPYVQLAWTIPGVKYSNTPQINVMEGVWQVCVRKDSTDDHYCFQATTSSPTVTSLNGAILTTPSELNSATFHYGCSAKNDDTCERSVIMAVKAGTYYFVTYDYRTGATAKEHQYWINSSSSYCLSCSIELAGVGDKIIAIGGYDANLSKPSFWVWPHDQNAGNNAYLQYTFDCSAQNLSTYVLSAIAVEYMAGSTNDLADYNFAAIGIEQGSKQQFFLLRCFKTLTCSLANFDAGIAIVNVRAQVSVQTSSYTDAFYYVETAFSKVLYRIHAAGSVSQFVVNTISFADQMVNTSIVGVAAISYTDGALLVGNYKQFEDKYSVVSKSPSTTSLSIFFIGIQGINSNAEYTIFDSNPPITSLTFNSGATADSTCGTLTSSSQTAPSATQANGLSAEYANNYTAFTTSSFVKNTQWMISNCATDEITTTPTSLSDISYQITASPTTTTVTIPTYSQSVTGCSVTKTLKYYNTATSTWVTAVTGTPAWILSVDSSLNLKIKTSDASFSGNSLTFKYNFLDTLSSNSLGSVDVQFTVTIISPCSIDKITVTSAPKSDITYQILPSATATSSTAVTIPTYTNTQSAFSSCIITKTLKYYDQITGQWINAVTGTPSWATVSSSLSLTVLTSDTSLHGNQIAFKYNFQDTQSNDVLGNVDDSTFIIKFNYKCLADTMTLNTANNIGVIDYLPSQNTVTIPISFTQLYSSEKCPKSVKTEWYNPDTNQWADIGDASWPLYNKVIQPYSSASSSFGIITISYNGSGSYSYNMRTTYISTDSLSSNAVLEDDWEINIRQNSCQDYVLTKQSEIADQIINDGGSLVANGYPAFSYDGPIASCAPQAKIYLLVNAVWVQQTVSSPFTFTATSTTSLTAIGAFHFEQTTSIGAVSSVTYDYKIVVANTVSLQPYNGGSLDFEFKLTIKNQCAGNVLSLGATTSDKIVQIKPTLNSVTTAFAFIGKVSPSVAACTSYQFSIEIQSATNSNWLELTSLTTYPWIISKTSTQIVYGTTDYATYNGKVFQVRYKIYDPLSLATGGIVYDNYQVTFTYVCQSDTVTLAAISDQSFTLGSSTLTIAVSTTQSNSDCASASTSSSLVYETYDTNSQTWVLASTQNWYVSESATQLRVNVNTANYASYQPSKLVTVRVTFTSLFSTQTNKSAQKTFTINFQDPCYNNIIVANNSPIDISLSFNVGKATVSTGQSVAKYTKTLAACSLLFSFFVKNPTTGVWQEYTTISATYPFILSDSLTQSGNEYTKTINLGKPASITSWTSYRPQSVFELKITVTDIIGYTSTQVVTWKVTLVDECAAFSITSNQSPISDFTYVMLQTSSTSISLNLNTNSCTTTYTLEYRTNPLSNYYNYATTPIDVISAWKVADGSFTILADKTTSVYSSYSPSQVFFIRLTARNTLSTSGNTYTEEFAVTFVDLCASNAVTEAWTTFTYAIIAIAAPTTRDISALPTTKYSKTLCPLNYQLSWFNSVSGTWNQFTQTALTANTEKFGATGTINTGQISIKVTEALFESMVASPYPDQNYNFKWVVTDSRSSSTQSSYTTTFQVVIRHGCKGDLVTLNSNIPSLTLPLRKEYIATVNFSQDEPTCAKTYLFEIYNTVTDDWTVYQAAAPYTDYISLYAGFNEVKFIANTQAYDQVSVKMRITITSVASLSAVTDTWTVNFIHPCRQQSTKSFQVTTTPVSSALSPVTNIVNLNPAAVTWSLLFDAWESLAQIQAYTDCTLSLTLTKDDFAKTAIPSGIYTVTSAFNSVNGSIDIASWNMGNYKGIIYVKTQITITSISATVYSKEIPVYVDIKNLCLVSQVYTSQTLTKIDYKLGDADIARSFSAYVDKPQVDYASPLCGSTAYAIVSASYQEVAASKMSISGNQIVLHQTTNVADVTNVDVQYYLKVYLTDYVVSSPTTAILYEPFLVNIKKCLTTSLTSDPNSSYNYNIYSGKIYIPYKPFVQVPLPSSLSASQTSCDYPLTYTANYRTYYDTLINLPYFIVWDQANKRFEVYSEDVADLTSNYQTYTIELTAFTSTADQNPTVTHTQSITVVVKNGCLLDEVSILSSTWVNPITYYLGGETDSPFFIEKGGPSNIFNWDASWQNSVPDCPWELKFEILNTGTNSWRDLTSSEKAIAVMTPNINYTPVSGTVYATPNTNLVIQTTDTSLDLTSWQIRATRKSTKSTSTSAVGIIQSTINWRHVCWDMPKKAAVPSSPATYTLFNLNQQITTFTAASSLWTDVDLCGPYTYTLTSLTAKTGYILPVDTSSFISKMTVALPSITAVFADRVYSNLSDNVGEYQLSLKTTYGKYGTDTKSFELKITNPCYTNDFMGDFKYKGNDDPDFMTYDPTAKLAAKIAVNIDTKTFTLNYPKEGLKVDLGGVDMPPGGSYSICGGRTVYLEYKKYSSGKISASGHPDYSFPYVTLTAFDTDADFLKRHYTVKFKSNSEFDYGLHEFYFKMQLNDYPESPPLSVPISVQVNPCVVSSFTAPGDLEFTYYIGSALSTLTSVFAQSPCSFGATYDVSRTDKSLASLPDYVQFSKTSSTVAINSKNPSDQGTIQVRVTATLENLDLLQNKHGLFSYKIDPYNLPADFIYQASFNINIKMVAPVYTQAPTGNTAPYLVPKPSKLKAYIGKSFVHSFGQPFDLENDNVTVAIKLGTAGSFATFDIFTNTLMIAQGASKSSDTRFNTIVLTLTDDSKIGALKTTYEFQLELEELLVDGQPPTKFVGEGLVDFFGFIATPSEIITNITATEARFEKRVYDLRNTTIEEIYTNRKNSTDFAKVDIFAGTPFQVPIQNETYQNSTDVSIKANMETSLPPPRIESLSSDGLLTIRFSKKIKVPKRYQDIEESEVALRWLKAAQGNIEPKKETILIGEGFKDFEIRPALDLKIFPAEEGGTPQDISFTWDIVSFKENEVKIQLYFENPQMLSTDPLNTDNMLVTFWANEFFVSEEGLEVKQGVTLQVKVIRQIDTENSTNYERQAKIFGYIVLVCLFVGLILAFCVGADTLPIWALYDTLLLIGHLTLMNVNMPGSQVIFLCTLIKTITFDFINAGSFITNILNQNGQNENLGVLFYQAGYESFFIIINLSNTILALLLLTALGFVAYCLDRHQECKLPKKQLNGRTIVQSYTWIQVVQNIFFRTLLSIYLVICVSIFINFKAISPQDSGVFQTCSFVTASFFLALMGGYILILLYVIARESYKEDRDKTLSPAFSTVFLGLKWNDTPNSIFYVIYCMIRKMAYAIVAVLLQDYPMQQIFCVVLSSMVMILLLQKLEPFVMPHNQKLIMLNEFLFYCACMVMLCFTPAFNIQPKHKERVGYMLPYIVITTICVNILLQIHAIWWQFTFNRRRQRNFLAFQAGQKAPKVIDQVMAKKETNHVVKSVDNNPIKQLSGLEQIPEETEEDTEQNIVRYNPRRHERKRSNYLSQVHPGADYYNSPTKFKQGDIESSTVTYANDMSADIMVIDDMLREPGIPIGFYIDRSMMSTPAVSGRDASDRPMLYNMSSEMSVDVTRDDNESVLEMKYDLGVFDKKNHHVAQQRVQGNFADEGTHEEITTFRKVQSSPGNILSSSGNHDQFAYRPSSTTQEEQDIEKELANNNQQSDRDSNFRSTVNASSTNINYNVLSKVQRREINRQKFHKRRYSGVPQSQYAGQQQSSETDFELV